MKASGQTLNSGRATLVVTALLLAALVVLPATAAAEQATVVVKFQVSPYVAAAVVDDGLVLHTNTAWVLTTETLAHDGSVVMETVNGPATGSAGLHVEVDNLVGYTLVAETTR